MEKIDSTSIDALISEANQFIEQARASIKNVQHAGTDKDSDVPSAPASGTNTTTTRTSATPPTKAGFKKGGMLLLLGVGLTYGAHRLMNRSN